MKKIFTLAFIALALITRVFAQDTSSVAKQIDSLDKLFKYQHGTIKVGNGIGTIKVPAGFKYLDSLQSLKVLTELWHNPKEANMTLGFILPEKQSVLAERGYVFNIQYDPIGYVKDDDAKDVNYDELLTNMQKETTEANAEREKAGYSAMSLVGWASKPYYDANRHILHWAKEIKFGADSINTLNYNVRVLGRKGVLVLNAISTMQDLNTVKADIPHVLNIVDFSSGYAYNDFNPDIDHVAAWTIGGLVAGKILAKVGFFALIVKFWKFIMIGVVAAFSFIKKMLTGKKEKEKANFEQGEPVAETAERSASEADTENTIEPETTEPTAQTVNAEAEEEKKAE